MGEIKYLTCPLCEATCGLEVTVEEDRAVSIRGDREDVFSQGFICPKSTALAPLDEDPDRIRTPLIKRDGEFVEASWDEAFAEIDRRLTPLLTEHGRNAAAVYLGNPAAHGLDSIVYGRAFVKALGTHNVFSASTVDQMPKHVSVGLMFGTMLTIPIPDVDRTDHLLILGANPLASNGSLLTAPDMRGRLRRIRERGGKVVVIDPKRTRTAEAADEHHFIKPGGDAALMAAMANVIFEEGLADVGTLAEHLVGLETVERACAPFTPESAEAACGIDAQTIRRLARELAAAPSAAVYGRIGTCTQSFGTLASWLVDVLNTITGNLDRPGGVMFPRPAAGGLNTSGAPGVGRGVRFGRWTSRVRGAEERFGELPASCLAEEIDTPGEQQVRALFTVAGNPAVSTPNAGRLAKALEQLDFMVSLDIYVNETTRHADVILPAPTALRRSHYDVAFYQLSARNVANFSPPALAPEPGQQEEWKTLLRLAAIAAGQGAGADVDAWDDLVLATVIAQTVKSEHSPIHGKTHEELATALEPRQGPERILDFLLRSGPYGEHFGGTPGGLSLAALLAAPHGIDLGALKPRIPEVLRTPSGKIELAPAEIVSDLQRLGQSPAAARAGSIVLVGRRQLRSNNSWLHNVEHLVRGPNDCSMQINPGDAERLALTDGGEAEISSRAGKVRVLVEVTDAVMPGVVSIPHGWGHDQPGMKLSVAGENAGVNSNILADEAETDPLSGNAVLSGIPVTIAS
jgi:anaerobic selenocysteine-containing dehydrogenase